MSNKIALSHSWKHLGFLFRLGMCTIETPPYSWPFWHQRRLHSPVLASMRCHWVWTWERFCKGMVPFIQILLFLFYKQTPCPVIKEPSCGHEGESHRLAKKSATRSQNHPCPSLGILVWLYQTWTLFLDILLYENNTCTWLTSTWYCLFFERSKGEGIDGLLVLNVIYN